MRNYEIFWRKLILPGSEFQHEGVRYVIAVTGRVFSTKNKELCEFTEKQHWSTVLPDDVFIAHEKIVSHNWGFFVVFRLMDCIPHVYYVHELSLPHAKVVYLSEKMISWIQPSENPYQYRQGKVVSASLSRKAKGWELIESSRNAQLTHQRSGVCFAPIVPQELWYDHKFRFAVKKKMKNKVPNDVVDTDTIETIDGEIVYV